jgi:hypothetical protein
MMRPEPLDSGDPGSRRAGTHRISRRRRHAHAWRAAVLKAFEQSKVTLPFVEERTSARMQWDTWSSSGWFDEAEFDRQPLSRT